ncbi:dUTP diphosphatase [Tumebacillus flagellatus]|uniref:dUTPase n=1 Tax=Tumebacillus flagellatus TaxID=1157490 RepID=A0A074MFL6_9BACL|nr:dUTP diphosphatase [Tumebacillus flagellatus]KEO84547.1 hypothetical protein EL26_03240 [Tumebacillus flagellatus]
MNFKRLYEIQQVLDQRILEEHGLTREETFPKKLLALQVELCELANETRCFKYWSRKGSAPQPKVLEEYVDALHFVLGLGLDLGYRDVAIPQTQRFAANGDADVNADRNTALTAQFQTLLTHCVALATPSPDTYAMLFSELLALGGRLGFTPDDIEAAYLAKNKKNHLRQTEGY